MKNIIKSATLAVVIAVFGTACSGDHGQNHSDSLKADTSVTTSANKTAPAAGSNGSAVSADTGLDKSGSGGTDTTKKR